MEDPIILKECTKCKQLLPLNKFAIRKERNGKRRNECNRCAHKKREEYYKTNPEVRKNKCKEYYQKNRLIKIEKAKEYYNSHKEEIRVRRRAYEQNKRKTDPTFKLKSCLRSRVREALKGNFKKATRTIELIGCSIEFLWTHLESQFQPGMTRENHGEWHIDHIKPVDSFDLSNLAQQKECFHWTNLQPLWKLDNWKKGNKYNPNLPVPPQPECS